MSIFRFSDSFRLHSVCLLLSLCCNFQYAFSTTYLNSAAGSIKHFLVSTHHLMLPLSLYWTILLNLWFVGFFIGLWVSRLLTDSRGRKPAFQIGCALSVIGSCLRFFSLTAHLPILLLIERFICAVATGCSYQCLILYLQEAPPTSCRGSASFLNGVTYSIISVLGVTLGNDKLLGDNLYIYLGFPVVVCIILFLVLIPIPDTPKLLVLQGRWPEARRAVQFFHGKYIDEDLALKTIKIEAELSTNSSLSYFDLVRVKHLRNALFLSIAALQGTVALWPILMSSTYFLQKVDVSESVAQWSSTAMTCAYAVGTISSTMLVERFGRRTLLLYSNVFNISSLIFYIIFAELSQHWTSLKYGCLLTFVLYGYTYGAGVGPIGRFISTELTPLQYRSAMCTVTYSINTIMNALTSTAFLPLFDAVGPYSFLILYVIPSILCFVYLVIYLPETKGREIADIVEILKRRKSDEKEVILE